MRGGHYANGKEYCMQMKIQDHCIKIEVKIIFLLHVHSHYL